MILHSLNLRLDKIWAIIVVPIYWRISQTNLTLMQHFKICMYTNVSDNNSKCYCINKLYKCVL